MGVNRQIERLRGEARRARVRARANARFGAERTGGAAPRTPGREEDCSGAPRTPGREEDCSDAPRTPDGGWLEPRLRLFAERGGEVVHREAVGAKEVGGGRVASHGKGRDMGRRVGEARKNEQSVGGEFARVFGRGVVTRRQSAGQHLDETGVGRRLERCIKEAVAEYGANSDDCGSRYRFAGSCWLRRSQPKNNLCSGRLLRMDLLSAIHSAER